MSEPNQAFVKRVREALGEGSDPLYVHALLSKTDAELLLWMYQTLCETEETVREEAQLERGEPHDTAYRLGLRILDGKFRLLQFVTAELAARNDAIVTETDGTQP